MTVSLRPLEERDLRRIYDWQRDPALYDHLVGDRREVAWDEARAWMVRHWLPQAADRRYALCLGGDGEMVGCVYLLAAPERPGEREFHIFIGDTEQRGRGVGRQALAEALRIAFRDPQVSAVRLEVLETNAAARRLYADAGFTETGRRPVAKRGRFVDAIAMTLSAADYRAR